MVAIIVAIAKNNVIGNTNDLPWYLPEDLKRFKKITTGHTVVMGRKTYESIINRLGKPLPNRKNVVITRQDNYPVPEGVLVFHDLDSVLQLLKNEDVFIIGGAEIFKLALPLVDTLYVTHVYKEYPGDVYFPEVNWSEWKKIEEEPHEEFSFATYIKQ
jgi:dihydrofolate reductase